MRVVFFFTSQNFISYFVTQLKTSSKIFLHSMLILMNLTLTDSSKLIEFRKNIDVCREQTIRASTMCTIYLSYMLSSIVLLCIVNSQHMLKIKDLSFAREATRSCLKQCLQSVLENINTCIINLKMINCVDFKRKIHTHARVCLFLN